MRLTLDTVGKLDWPKGVDWRPLYPDGFEELTAKLDRPLHPPGRDVRCIVSVGMLTEGWDCNTVTHIIGLRPFMSQLLCEQVVGRGLRRASYDPLPDGRLPEETALILGVPFQVVPFKQSAGGTPNPREKRHHVRAVPEKAQFEIGFPRVEGYRQAIRNRVQVDWDKIAILRLDPKNIPPEIQMKAGMFSNKGRHTLLGPGAIAEVSLNPYRAVRRLQELEFDLARDLVRHYATQSRCEAPPHVLFPQLVGIARKFLREKVQPVRPADLLDVFLSPYYGWVIEHLVEAIHPDTSAGEAPELPRYESSRAAGSTAEVDYWTSRDVREVIRSHLNYVVADTKTWEQSAAYYIDTHPAVDAFVKNAGLGFSIPYLHNGELHDYQPDFIVRLSSGTHLIVETKGYDELADVKRQAAERWVRAVNADGTYGRWAYALTREVEAISDIVSSVAARTVVS